MSFHVVTIEEAGLTEVGRQTFQAFVSQSDDRMHSTGTTANIQMLGLFRMYDSMKNRQPDERLRLSLHPTEKVAKFDLILI